MTTSFLTDASETPAIRVSPSTITEPTANRESVKILIIGSPRGVSNTIQTLYRLGFAEVTEWSSLQPTTNPGEVMSILIRKITIS